MIFRVPTPVTYLGSLILAILLSGIIYAGLNAQEITGNLFYLAAGLIVGHLTGVFASSKTTTNITHREKSNSHDSTAGTGNTVSLYVGNLAYKVRNDSLRKHFTRFGNVYSVRIMTDRNTNKPRGYAFVEMDNTGAEMAMDKLNNTEFFGRQLKVSTARQRAED